MPSLKLLGDLILDIGFQLNLLFELINALPLDFKQELYDPKLDSIL